MIGYILGTQGKANQGRPSTALRFQRPDPLISAATFPASPAWYTRRSSTFHPVMGQPAEHGKLNIPSGYVKIAIENGNL